MSRRIPLLTLWVLCFLSSHQPASADDTLLLEVVLNGRPTGKLGEFHTRGSALFATRRELGELGLQAGEGIPDELVAIAGLQGVSARLDPASQRLLVAARTAALAPNLLVATAPAEPPLSVESGVGAVLNYDVSGTESQGRTRLESLLDARLFSPFGVLGSQALLRGGAGLHDEVRLESTYTYSDPDSLRRVRLGDVISSGLAWTRSVRLGGGQIARDFSLRPDLVTFPIPTIAGQVAVPSTVDVLVNGVQTLSSKAEPGPFEVRQLPVVNGVNTISIVLQNPLGRQVTQTLPVYASAALLAPGLDAYSLELGAVRLGFGTVSNDYRQAAGSASYRRGLTDWLTLSAHGEATDTLAMGGGGASVSLGNLGVVSLAVAGSTLDSGQGVLGYAAYERVTPTLSLYASVQHATRGFRDVASLYGDPAPFEARRFSAGYALGRFGTVNVAYNSLRRFASPRAALSSSFGPTGFDGSSRYDPLVGPVFALPSRTSLISASYSVPVLNGRATFYATAYRDLARVRSSGAVFGLTFPLGPRQSASLGAGVDVASPYGTVQATRSVIAVGDVGGQVYLSQGDQRRALATAQYKSPVALLEADGYYGAGQPAWRARASGALVLAGGGLFASNAVNDSFAVVDTGGVSGVMVTSENRPVERTGSSGRVLVPDLRSFERNRLGIVADTLPFDVEVGQTSRVVRPADRSGVLVRFGVERSRSALVRLVGADGRPVPVGAHARLEPDGAEVTVGYDGQVYLRHLPTRVSLRVALPGGRACLVRFTFHPVAGDVPTVGPLACLAAEAR